MTALFERDGDTYLPTEFSRGGWSDDHLHGGPPSGLMARAIEEASSDMWTARITFDLIRPVPLAPLTYRTDVAKKGRNVRIVEAALICEGVDVAWARALQIRETDLPVPETDYPFNAPPGPEGIERMEWGDRWGGNLTRFHIDGVDIRSVDDSFETLGPGTAWYQLTGPLVAGEDTTPLQTLGVMSDLANGVSRVLPFDDWIYVNTDITLYIQRFPVGNWVGMQATSYPMRHGVGINAGSMFDATGPLGFVGQAQLLSMTTE